MSIVSLILFFSYSLNILLIGSYGIESSIFLLNEFLVSKLWVWFVCYAPYPYGFEYFLITLYSFSEKKTLLYLTNELINGTEIVLGQPLTPYKSFTIFHDSKTPAQVVF